MDEGRVSGAGYTHTHPRTTVYYTSMPNQITYIAPKLDIYNSYRLVDKSSDLTMPLEDDAQPNTYALEPEHKDKTLCSLWQEMQVVDAEWATTYIHNTPLAT
jgi:hypothetical protein